MKRCHVLVSLTVITASMALIAPSTIYGQVNRNAPRFTPTIDGTISAQEMARQMVYEMVWPVSTGSLLLDASGSSEEEISATWYVSWDATNLYISTIVKDNTKDFRNIAGENGNQPYNGQDVAQPTFNPLNDPSHMFPPDPGGGPAAIYDMIVDTADEFGPDIYRHGSALSEEEHATITIRGQVTERIVSGQPEHTGYMLEASIPWATAMDDVDPSYVPNLGDMHGLSFILVSYNGEPGGSPGDRATLMTDFGEGGNTIADPTTWNTITLVASTLQCDLNSDGVADAADAAIMFGNWGRSGAGDCNGDNTVDAADGGVLFGEWTGDAQSVPEPAGVGLWMGSLVLWRLGCRSRRR